MEGINSCNISFNSSPVFILIAVILLIVYSWFIYRFTIPAVSIYMRTFLFLIRSLIIILLLLLILEPRISIKYNEKEEPVNFLFIDNSASLSVKDSLIRAGQLRDLAAKVQSEFSTNLKSYLFGIKPVEYDAEKGADINFKEPLTNFYKIFKLIDSLKVKRGSVIIASDGIVSDGNEPVYEAEKTALPVFTIGIGDTTPVKDLIVKDVSYNQFIYSGTPTVIETTLLSEGYFDGRTKLSLYEDDRLIQSKDALLSPGGLNRIGFDYFPETPGEKKMRVTASDMTDESNIANNTRTFFLNVLKNKIKIALVAGSPSPDLSAISTILNTNKNLSVDKIVQVGPEKYWERLNLTVIDSADILLLVDFPSRNTPAELSSKVFSSIQKKKPYLIIVTPDTELSKLKQYENGLPFTIRKIIEERIPVQPELIPGNFNQIFSGLSSRQDLWRTLAPVSRTGSEIIAKEGSEVLLNSIVRTIQTNSPLMVSRNIAGYRSIAFLAGELWRWQLGMSNDNPLFLQGFFNDIIKWLNISGTKNQFTIRTDKKVYSRGERAEFTAELYDQTFSPVNSAEINLILKSGRNDSDIKLTRANNGVYRGSIELNEDGDYSFDAIAFYDGVEINSDRGRFSVNTGETELLNTKMNSNLLKSLSSVSGGEYYPINSYDGIFEKLKTINSASQLEKPVYREYSLWTNEWIMAIIICLFALEWFLRKRSGML